MKDSILKWYAFATLNFSTFLHSDTLKNIFKGVC